MSSGFSRLSAERISGENDHIIPKFQFTLSPYSIDPLLKESEL